MLLKTGIGLERRDKHFKRVTAADVKFFVSNFFNFQGCLRTGCLNGGSCIYCENSYACSCKEPQTEEKKGRTLGKGKFIVCLLKYPFSRIAVVKVLAVL